MKTVRFKFSKIAALVLLGSLALGACKKDNDNEKKQNIVEIVTGNANFSLLETALIHANLSSVLEGNGPFTVFAPNNAAFIAAGLDTEAKIKAMPVEALKRTLLYHVLSSRVPSTSIATASNTAVTTAAETNVYVTKNNSGVYVNGATVVNADIDATNGVIHVINKVLMPPSGNIVQMAQADANFSFLVAAVVRASEGSTNVAQVLSGNGPYTVFAPTNQAFINAGFANVEAIQTADPAALTRILTYHVVSGRVFSSDLTEGAKPATLQTGTVTITLSGGAKVRGNANTTASNITATNLVATNGLIHVVDQVLLP
jgi:uncharacterized surface protein with fasciclin (FAS1) repeats